MTQNWSTPVIFETNVTGRFQAAQGPLEALRILDGWWQKVDGPAFQEAINLCIDAARGEADLEDARAAFVMALTEGGVRIMPDADADHAHTCP